MASLVNEQQTPSWTEQLLCNIVDDVARTNPDDLVAEYPKSPVSYNAGFRKINFANLANAINGVAWWLHRELGPCTEFNTLAYIGPNDMRYVALILGAVKAGYKVSKRCLLYHRELANVYVTDSAYITP